GDARAWRPPDGDSQAGPIRADAGRETDRPDLRRHAEGQERRGLDPEHRSLRRPALHAGVDRVHGHAPSTGAQAPAGEEGPDGRRANRARSGVGGLQERLQAHGREGIDGLPPRHPHPDQVGAEHAEDHQGVEAGRRRQAAPRAGRGGADAAFFGRLRYAMAKEVADDLIVEFRERKLDAVHLLYNQFKSAIAQAITFIQLLPIAAPPSAAREAQGGFITPEHLYEPSRPQLLETLIPRQLAMSIWRALLESEASAPGPRLTAMASATKNANRL